MIKKNKPVKSPFNFVDHYQCNCGKMLLKKDAQIVISEFKGNVYKVGLCQNCAEVVERFYKTLSKHHGNINKKRKNKKD